MAFLQELKIDSLNHKSIAIFHETNGNALPLLLNKVRNITVIPLF